MTDRIRAFVEMSLGANSANCAKTPSPEANRANGANGTKRHLATEALPPDPVEPPRKPAEASLAPSRDPFLLPVVDGGFRCVPLDLPDLATAPIGRCRGCGFIAPMSPRQHCGKCEVDLALAVVEENP